MTSRRALLLLLSMGVLPSAFAGTAAESLLIGVGAPGVGMGQAYTAAAEDATAMYWNPAGMTSVEHVAVSLDHASYPLGGGLEHAAVVCSLGPLGAIGASGRYFSAGGITGLDSSQNFLGTFKPYDASAGAGYALRLGPLSIGGAWKEVRSKVAEVAKTTAFDAGARIALGDHLIVAGAASNLGGSLKYTAASEEEDLPSVTRAGIAVKLLEDNALLLTAEGGFPKGLDAYGAAGVEYSKMIPYATGSLTASVRLGYNTIQLKTKGVAGVTAGFGVLLSNHLGVDYAFMPMGSIGVSHHISLSYKL
jgi:hypothetical protein